MLLSAIFLSISVYRVLQKMDGKKYVREDCYGPYYGRGLFG